MTPPPGTHPVGRRTLVTGGSGKVGGWILPAIAARGDVVVFDLQPPASGIGSFVEGDVTDPAAVRAAVAGCDAVVHLAAIPDEAPLASLLEVNVAATGHVLEAARLEGVSRVVLASSNRLTGAYGRDDLVRPGDPPRPDTFYGVSKVAVEALGRLYVDRWALEVVCVRIGTAAPRPRTMRDLSTWVSPGDLARCFVAALSEPVRGFECLYAVSRNTRSWWRNDPAGISYEALDDAERFAVDVGPDDADARPDRQGLLRPWPS